MASMKEWHDAARTISDMSGVSAEDCFDIIYSESSTPAEQIDRAAAYYEREHAEVV